MHISMEYESAHLAGPLCMYLHVYVCVRLFDALNLQTFNDNVTKLSAISCSTGDQRTNFQVRRSALKRW